MSSSPWSQITTAQSSSMEQHVWSTCQQFLISGKPLSLQSLASLRSLIINPHTSTSTITSILENLTRSLQLTTRNSLLHHYILKLLTDLPSHRPYLSPQIFDSVRSNSVLSTESSHLAANSVAALVSISDFDSSLRVVLDDQFFVSLCFSPSVSVRLCLLRNAERFSVQPHVLFTVFFGFTKDPYPYVREAALGGLVGLCKYRVFDDFGLIEGCYSRAIELLRDNEDCVRSAAVRVVSEWGQMLVAATEEKDKTDCSNVVFIQLCSMVRDMSVHVRVEAFNALGKIKLVSENILLQTLSKKVLGITKEKKPHGQCNAERSRILASAAAGAFVHGLEDESYEVRHSTCLSLRMLTILSAEFSERVLSLLMDMLNDDSMIVRLEVLETLHHMATFEILKVLETHMHMFLGTLIDNNNIIRSAARKILKSVRLPNLELFRMSVNSLLENLEIHPQDEADVFSVLFYMGRHHGKFSACIVNEVCQEIEPVAEGKLNLDTARVAAFLVLAISVPLTHDHSDQSIPPRLFSYAVTLLGRISCALNDLVDQNTLLAYLSQCSRSSGTCGREVEGEADIQIDTGMDGSNSARMHSQQISSETSEVQPLVSLEATNTVTALVEKQQEDPDEVRKSMNLILAKVKDIWLLVESGCINEVLRTLRTLKEELAMFTPVSFESVAMLAFTLQYLKVVKLLTKLWGQIFWKDYSYGLGELGILFRKFDASLKELRSRFIGLSKEEELQILELTVVGCILWLSTIDICCCPTASKRLSAAIYQIECLYKEGSIDLSNFLLEVQKTFCENGTSIYNSCSSFPYIKLLNLFFLRQFSVCSRLKHINAELNAPDNDLENPLPFVSGLPVGIPLEITLHNVSSENRLWLRITVGEGMCQFVFLDRSIVGGSDEVKNFRFVAPFYKTPKASSLVLKVCIGMECVFGDVNKGHWGPKCELLYLHPEKVVYLHRN